MLLKRRGKQVAIQMLLKAVCKSLYKCCWNGRWRRTRGTHGGRHKYCRPVAMEAICQPGYYVRRRAWAVFPKSDAKRGQPSSGRWRQENAAGEAAERISALSGIGAGTSKSMAMAAGEDDADKFKAGGVLTCSASVQDSGEDRVTNTCGAYDVNHLKCVRSFMEACVQQQRLTQDLA